MSDFPKKAGQPDNPLQITAGRRAVLNQLDAGVADKSAQAHAANWLRDLAKHYGLSNRYLTGDRCYRDLMAGTCTDAEDQKAALDWIYRLLAERPHFDTGQAISEDMGRIVEEVNKLSIIPDANDRQHGGDHYMKRPIQHWDFVASNGYRYLTGQATKYVFRWKDKGGLLDLEKADHFLEKQIEERETDGELVDLGEFLKANDITGDEAYVIAMVHAFHETDNLSFLRLARQGMARLREKAAGDGAVAP